MARTLPAVLLLSLLLLAPTAVAKEVPAAVTAEERNRAIDRALVYLANAVPRLPDSEGTPRRPFTAATTGYVFLLAGERTGTRRSKQRVLVADLKDFVMRYLEEVEDRSRNPKELPSSQGVAESWALIQYTWPCAVAALFFAEMHQRGLYQDEAKDAVERLVKVLGEAQQENGGWGHGRARAEGSYPNTLLASSALVASAVGLVKRSMNPPGTEFLDKSPDYFRDAQLRNGNYPYDPSQRSADFDELGAGRAAGAIFALWCMDVPLTDRTIKRSIKYLDAHLEQVAEGHGSAAMTLLFGALAAKVRGEKAWAAFKKTFFRRMIDAQARSGSFTCICKGTTPGTTNDSKPPGGLGMLQKGADAYVTAIHTWILLLDRETPKTMSPRPAAQTTPR